MMIKFQTRMQRFQDEIELVLKVNVFCCGQVEHKQITGNKQMSDTLFGHERQQQKTTAEAKWKGMVAETSRTDAAAKMKMKSREK